MTARAAAKRPAMLVVLVDNRCLGCTLARGPMGFEAFTADEVSLGVFETAEAARDALIAEASHG